MTGVTDVAVSLGEGVWIVGTRRYVVLLRPGRVPRTMPTGSVASWAAILDPYMRRSRKRRDVPGRAPRVDRLGRGSVRPPPRADLRHGRGATAPGRPAPPAGGRGRRRPSGDRVATRSTRPDVDMNPPTFRADRPVPTVVAHLAEPWPARGPDGLLAQLAAIRRRAGRDGVALGRLVVESGGAATSAGLGRRLAWTLAAAACDPRPRVLYVADTRHLASGPAAELEALELLFRAGFEIRAPCGRIAPRGRRIEALRRAAAREARTVRAVRARPVRRASSPATSPIAATTPPSRAGAVERVR